MSESEPDPVMAAWERRNAIREGAEKMPDPSEEVIAYCAHVLSEWLDDAAPLHEHRYRNPAKAVAKSVAYLASRSPAQPEGVTDAWEVANELRRLAQKWGAAEGRQDGRLAIADRAADYITAQEAEIAGLREALKPFAGYGRQIKRRKPERSPEVPIMSYPVQTDDDPLGMKYGDITRGDFIRAAQCIDIPDLVNIVRRARASTEKETR